MEVVVELVRMAVVGILGLVVLVRMVVMLVGLVIVEVVLFGEVGSAAEDGECCSIDGGGSVGWDWMVIMLVRVLWWWTQCWYVGGDGRGGGSVG